MTHENQFTPRAEEALRLAQEAAEEMGHGYVGTEHILLGLMREEDGIAHRVMREYGMTEDMICTVLERSVGKGLSGAAPSQGLTPRAKSAVELAPKFKQTALREYNEYVRTEKECVELAQARLDSQALNFVSGSGTCVGIPELIPGRYITVKGLDGDTEGNYFLSKVRHRFTKGGYFTQFEVKGAKA